MNSVWRTGTYLNAVFLARSASNYKTCRMVADQTTLNDEYPVIRIIFEPETAPMNLIMHSICRTQFRKSSAVPA